MNRGGGTGGVQNTFGESGPKVCYNQVSAATTLHTLRTLEVGTTMRTIQI
jgi:hypothetical protein